MPQDSLVWIVLIVAAALVIALAVWKGRGFRLSKGKEGFSVEVERSQGGGDKPARSSRISVAKGAQIEAARVGDIAGVKTAGRPPPTGRAIDVASGSRIKDAEVGDIVGVKQTERDPDDKQ